MHGKHSAGVCVTAVVYGALDVSVRGALGGSASIFGCRWWRRCRARS